MDPRILKTAKIFIGLAIFVWFGLNLAHKIDLTTADLGRHIENGNIIVHGSWQEKWAVLHTNFYSYTLSEQPFINHHWLSGLLFYFIYIASGFVGLSVFYVFLGLATLWLFFDVARKASNFLIAASLTVFIIPLITSRVEVRPEILTYFFTGAFFWLLWHWRMGKLKHLWLMLLPAVMLLWVNLHIGFVFGFLVLGGFGLEQLIKFLQKKPNGFIQLLFTSALCLIAGLANPFGYKLLVYPFLIFKNYGYLIVENQSVGFLEHIHFTSDQHFLLFKLVAGALLLSFLAAAVKDWRKFDIALFVLTAVTAVMAYFGIRNFPSFVFFALPAMAANVYKLKSRQLHMAYRYGLGLMTAFILTLALFYQYQTFAAAKPLLGLGLMSGANASADFFKANHIAGPIFNNYDIGGYLIFKLWNPHPLPLPSVADKVMADKKGEGETVFVDNRPEAYTADFFQKLYIPAQQDEQKWQALEGQYNFNAIFFSYRDYTPWAQTFLINRLKDKTWVPVFADSYNVIFVKLNRQNLDVIKRYALPASTFGVIPQ